jgi:hypothetical protein
MAIAQNVDASCVATTTQSFTFGPYGWEPALSLGEKLRFSRDGDGNGNGTLGRTDI